MTVPFLSFNDLDNSLDWDETAQSIYDGHMLPKASVADGFAYRGDDTLLSRSAWIDGLGVAVKAATIVPENTTRNMPKIHGGVMIFNDITGELDALIDFHLVTKWKTVGDSLLGARLLARPDSTKILIVGAGTVAHNLVHAYSTLFPSAKFSIWNRSAKNAQRLASDLDKQFQITAVDDLQIAVQNSDIICCATMATEPVVDGKWLQNGQHLDLIGAYRPDMREVNDTALQRARIFVDSRETTIDHIGELKIPISNGVITKNDVIADYYDISKGTFQRETNDEITLFKNGGGAHMDLMVSSMILKKWHAQGV